MHSPHPRPPLAGGAAGRGAGRRTAWREEQGSTSQPAPAVTHLHQSCFREQLAAQQLACQVRNSTPSLLSPRLLGLCVQPSVPQHVRHLSTQLALRRALHIDTGAAGGWGGTAALCIVAPASPPPGPFSQLLHHLLERPHLFTATTNLSGCSWPATTARARSRRKRRRIAVVTPGTVGPTSDTTTYMQSYSIS